MSERTRGPRLVHGVGVMIDRSDWRVDAYRGTAAALIAAGLATGEQFPGQPGRNRTACSYWPDGSPAIKGSPGKCRLQPDAKRVTLRHDGTFQVDIVVSTEEQARRSRRDDMMLNAGYECETTRPVQCEQSAPFEPNPRDGLRSMGVMHWRTLPPGWRVFAGAGQGAAQLRRSRPALRIVVS